MPVEYVNRRGERYFVLQGKTKTGKPKYYASRKNSGTPVERLPEGFEIYEEPGRGLVSIRKVRPSLLTPAEREQLEAWVRELAGIEYFRVEIDGDSLIVHTPETDPADAADALAEVFGRAAVERNRDWIGRRATYMPMFRFTLVDEDERLFNVERWCFLGSINDWFYLSGGEPLEALARKYLPHLNRESFFELM